MTKQTTRRGWRAIGFLMSAVVAGTLGCAGDDELAAFLEREETLYSQQQEEEIIRYFFQDERDGFYLDVGCSHYKDGSTTFYLEEHLGWRGIGIDAQPGYGVAWRQHRPNSKYVWRAVSDKTGETLILHQAGGISATELDTKNLEHWKSVKDGIKTREMKVKTITLDDLLDREGVTKIDFLSMDINGAEPYALAGFDIERFKPRLVHIEASKHRHEELLAYFEKHDYERIDAFLEYDFVNWYFKPKS